MPAEPAATVLVDGNNVIGSVPDGWWRDRPGAVRRLLARLQAWAARRAEAGAGGSLVVLVLDRAQPDLAEGAHGGVTVRYATRRGRDAADDRIVALLDAGGDPATVEVVTSDRALAERARRRGARVTGAGDFLRRLAATGDEDGRRG